MAQRILVIGCSGAGKSTLARAIADRYQLPLIHLDRFYWQPGWKAPSDAEWFAQVERLIAEPQWVMDGNFSSTLARRAAVADAIVFLDLPRWLCLIRVLRRIALGYGKARADVAPGCPERFDWAFLKWIWNYPKRSRPKTLALLKDYPKSAITLHSKGEVRRWIAAGCPFAAAG